jgi:hypothetical protein
MGRVNLIKITMLPKAIYRQSNAHRTFSSILYINRKINPENHRSIKKTQTIRSNPEQKCSDGGITMPDFQL